MCKINVFIVYYKNMKDQKKIRKNKKDFLWGVTQVGQQVEGNCTTNNWDTWARRSLVPRCDLANDYWNRFKEDHDLLEELGVRAYRLSIDWGRVEIKEDEYDADVIAHYREILLDVKKRDIKVILGLWHYTFPSYIEQKYKLQSKIVREKFKNFVKIIRDELGDLVDMVIVLNEPMVFVGTSFLLAQRPPFRKNPLIALGVINNLIAFHKDAYKLWKQKYPKTKISSAHLWNDLGSKNNNFLENVAVKISKIFRVSYFLWRLNSTSDFIGLNYYTSDKLEFCGFRKKEGGILGFRSTANWPDPEVWRDFPPGLYRVLVQVKKYKKPIYILENGKPTDLGKKDIARIEFLRKSVFFMKKAMSEGVDVRGYFHYALADAFEWTSGYDFRFGLVEINRKNLKRTKRDSFFVYKDIIRGDE